jgi:hypothetical protein
MSVAWRLFSPTSEWDMYPESPTALHKYWVYFLDDQDNFLDAEVVEAVDDLDAFLHLQTLHAQTQAEAYVIELWDRDRLIGRVEPEDYKRTNVRIV